VATEVEIKKTDQGDKVYHLGHNTWVNKEARNIQTIVCGRVMHRRLSKITRLIEAEHSEELDQAHRAVIVEPQPRKQPPPFMCYFC